MLEFKLKSIHKLYVIELYFDKKLIGNLQFEEKDSFDDEFDPDYSFDNIENCIYIHKIWVEPSERNKGYGNKLMEKFFEIVPKPNMVLLYPLAFETGSSIKLSDLIDFYIKFGFEPYDTEDKFNLYMFRYV
jgi:GNAT superfamily N-acetyltransferase